MKLLITQDDLRQAVSVHLATFGFQVSAESINVDVDNIEIDLNPSNSATPDSDDGDKPKRSRRTRAEIEAEKKQALVETLTAPEPEVLPETDVLDPTEETIYPSDATDKEPEVVVAPKDSTSLFD